MRKECGYCLKSVSLKKDKFILLGTYDGKKTLEERYYHINCFKLWFDESVHAKAKNIVNSMQKKIMPLARNMIKQVMGG